MVGFNRRFALMLATMKANFGPASSSSVTRYLVNAGPLAADSWYRDEGEGSRFTGEGGHFLDTLSWWADSLPEEVYAVGGPDSDDVQVTVRFGTGATGGVISYLTWRQRALRQGDAGRHRRRPQRAAGQLPQGHRVGRTRSRHHPGPGRAGQGAACRADPFRRSLRGRRSHADPVRVAGRHHPRDDRGAGQPAERQAGAGVSGSGASRLGWYAHRAARMSPAEMAWRARDQLIRAAWAPRQVTREQLAKVVRPAPAAMSWPSPRRCPPGTAARVAGGGQEADPGDRGPAAAGRIGRPRLACAAHRPGTARLVP